MNKILSQENVVIIERLPTPEEYLALMEAVEWVDIVPPNTAHKALEAARFGVVAVLGEQVVGAGLVLSDGVSFSYLKDIMVLPQFQRHKIGSQIVEALMGTIRRTAPDGMLVTLFTGENRAEFFEPFGFCGPQKALYGMSLRIGG